MSKKVLVIEDNHDIRENISEILQLAGYVVFEADNGKTGIDLALKNLPDIILCDIMMPELDGYGVLFFVRVAEFFPSGFCCGILFEFGQ